MQRLKLRAKKEGKEVKLLPSKSMQSLGGTEVHILFPGEKPSKKNWVSWMMEIPDHCVC
jgi:hypothetical protein